MSGGGGPLVRCAVSANGVRVGDVIDVAGHRRRVEVIHVRGAVRQLVLADGEILILTVGGGRQYTVWRRRPANRRPRGSAPAEGVRA